MGQSLFEREVAQAHDGVTHTPVGGGEVEVLSTLGVGVRFQEHQHCAERARKPYPA